MELAVDGDIAIRASGLDRLSKDPVDRLIVATALQPRSTRVTAEESLLGWQHPLVRQDARK